MEPTNAHISFSHIINYSYKATMMMIGKKRSKHIGN